MTILLNNGLIPALKSFYEAFSNNNEALAVFLDCTAFALAGGELSIKKTGFNPVNEEIIESKLVDDIEDLQESASNTVAQKAYNIIVKYFGGVDEF